MGFRKNFSKVKDLLIDCFAEKQVRRERPTEYTYEPMAVRYYGCGYDDLQSHVRFPNGAKPPPPSFRTPKLKEQPGVEPLKSYKGTGKFHGPVRWTPQDYGNKGEMQRPNGGKDAGSMDVNRCDTRPYRNSPRGPTGGAIDPIYDPITFYNSPTSGS